MKFVRLSNIVMCPFGQVGDVVLTGRATQRIADDVERGRRVRPTELPVDRPGVEVDPVDGVVVATRHEQLIVTGPRPVEVEVDGVGVDRAEVIVTRGRGLGSRSARWSR